MPALPSNDNPQSFDHPPTPEKAHFGAGDIGWQVLGPALGCSVLASAIVAARWYSRCKIARCVGVDDYVILLSLMLSWAMTITIGVSVHEGVGVYHSASEASQIARLVVAGNVLWILIVNITKASILSQYLRIFSAARTRALCYALLAALVPAAAYSIFLGIFLCIPTAKLWDPDLPGSCRSAETYWFSVAGLDISLDFLVLALPLPAILALRLPTRQKVAVVLAFTLGFFVCAVSVARVVAVHVTADQGHVVESGVWAIVWSAVEANVGICCACLLSLKPLAGKLFPRLFAAEQDTPARHAMRIKNVHTSRAVWDPVHCPSVRHVNTGVLSQSRPSASSGGGGEKELKRCSTARTAHSWQVESVNAGQNQTGQSCRDASGSMDIWEVLWRPEVAVFGHGR